MHTRPSALALWPPLLTALHHQIFPEILCSARWHTSECCGPLVYRPEPWNSSAWPRWPSMIPKALSWTTPSPLQTSDALQSSHPASCECFSRFARRTAWAALYIWSLSSRPVWVLTTPLPQLGQHEPYRSMAQELDIVWSCAVPYHSCVVYESRGRQE